MTDRDKKFVARSKWREERAKGVARIETSVTERRGANAKVTFRIVGLFSRSSGLAAVERVWERW